jgi:hypothetical protein
VSQRTVPAHQVQNKGKQKSRSVNESDSGTFQHKIKPEYEEKNPKEVKDDDKIRDELVTHSLICFLKKSPFGRSQVNVLATSGLMTRKRSTLTRRMDLMSDRWPMTNVK